MNDLVNAFIEQQEEEKFYHLNDYEKVEYLQNLLIGRATGHAVVEHERYKNLRLEFMSHAKYKNLIPDFIRHCRSIDEARFFIDNKIRTSPDNIISNPRQLIWNAFNPLFEKIEHSLFSLLQAQLEDVLSSIENTSDIILQWNKMMDRVENDPKGAITASRTLLELTCKFILDSMHVEYKDNIDNIDFNSLYNQTVEALNLHPNQHGKAVFKKLLGSMYNSVGALSELRNAAGDAHGQLKSYKPKKRHALLAVNLAGSISLFLMSTYEHKKEILT